MMNIRLKSAHWAAIASVAVGLLAVAPGSWGSALAQTAGPGDPVTTPAATSTAPATATTTGTPIGSPSATSTAATPSPTAATASPTAATASPTAIPIATPPPPAVVTVTVVVNNQQQTIVTTPGNLASIVLEPGSQVTSISVVVAVSPTDLGAGTLAAVTAVSEFLESGVARANDIDVGYVFVIDFGGSTASRSQALVMSGDALPQFGRASFQAAPVALAKPAKATLNVLPATLAQVGGDLSRLSVVWVDPVKKIVEPVKVLPSPRPGVLAFEFTKAGSYAVLVNEITVPAVTAPRPANTGTGTADLGRSVALPVVGALLALGAVGALGGRAMRGRRA